MPILFLLPEAGYSGYEDIEVALLKYGIEVHYQVLNYHRRLMRSYTQTCPGLSFYTL